MIATYPEVRAALIKAADTLDHPYKANHSYGSTAGTVVYAQGGQIGLRVKGKYFIGRGGDHESSAYALASVLELKVTRRKEKGKVEVPSPEGVKVDEVNEAAFKKFANPEGKSVQES